MPKERFARALGARLKQARETARYTQVDVAQELEITQPTIANWEAGRSLPDLWAMRQLCYVYGLPSDFFLQGFMVLPLAMAAKLPEGVCEPLDRARQEFRTYLRTYSVPGYDSGPMRL